MNIDWTKGYLIIPKLIAQPTWGGTYIVNSKGWKNSVHAETAIGQSYELYSHSLLSPLTSSSDINFLPEVENGISPPNTFPISDLININKERILGRNSIKKFNGELKTLIKFTQAKGNSFQIHIKPEVLSEKWHPKPESWYFFEDGIATLGIKDLTKLDDYKRMALDIYEFLIDVSTNVKTKKITLQEARVQINKFIDNHSLYDFVNLIPIPANTIIDLSQGGIHHSWEEDVNLPQGNIIYEVQVDVMDSASTIRSYDKGKLTEEGDIRPLQIDDYFTYLDKDPVTNQPENLFQAKKNLYEDALCSVSEIFKTNYYSMNETTLIGIGEASNEYTHTKEDSFHHLFVRKGEIEYRDLKGSLHVTAGHSMFVPACVGKYYLKPIVAGTTVLTTFI